MNPDKTPPFFQIREKRADHKKYLLRLLKKSWIMGLGILAGALIAAAGYKIYRSVQMPVEYQGISKYYITFEYDESGEVYQYYNGYTWNDLLDTDPVMNKVLETVSDLPREEIEEATTGEILSDIRLLTTTVSTGEKNKTAAIQKALEQALTKFGEEQPEIAEIEVIESSDPVLVLWDDKTTNGAILGAVLGFLITFFAVMYYLVLDERVYTPRDLEDSFENPFLGIQSRKALEASDLEISKNLEAMGLLDTPQLLLTDDFDDFLQELNRVQEKRKAENTALENPDTGVILKISWGRTSLQLIERCLSSLKNRNISMKGFIITDADQSFLDRYYGKRKTGALA